MIIVEYLYGTEVDDVNAAQWNLLLEATGLWMYALVGVEQVV